MNPQTVPASENSIPATTVVPAKSSNGLNSAISSNTSKFAIGIALGAVIVATSAVGAVIVMNNRTVSNNETIAVTTSSTNIVYDTPTTATANLSVGTAVITQPSTRTATAAVTSLSIRYKSPYEEGKATFKLTFNMPNGFTATVLQNDSEQAMAKISNAQVSLEIKLFPEAESGNANYNDLVDLNNTTAPGGIYRYKSTESQPSGYSEGMHYFSKPYASPYNLCDTTFCLLNAVQYETWFSPVCKASDIENAVKYCDMVMSSLRVEKSAY